MSDQAASYPQPALDLSTNGYSTEPACPTQGVAAGKRRVLVVDDNLDAAEGLAMLLGLRGHQVATAYDGFAAIDQARELRPEVVLLDIGLPRLDGFEVAKRLRAEHADRPMLLVALTGYGQERDRRRAHQAGFDHHLLKPVRLEVLELLLNVVGDAPAPAERSRAATPPLA